MSYIYADVINFLFYINGIILDIFVTTFPFIYQYVLEIFPYQDIQICPIFENYAKHACTTFFFQNIHIKFTATFVEFNLCYKTYCIGNYFKPLRKNIHGLRCNWFCVFFGEKVRAGLWKEGRRTVGKQDLRLSRGMTGELCLGSCSIKYIVVFFLYRFSWPVDLQDWTQQIPKGVSAQNGIVHRLPQVVHGIQNC